MEVIYELTISQDTLLEAEALAASRGTSVNEMIVIALEHELINAALRSSDE